MNEQQVVLNGILCSIIMRSGGEMDVEIVPGNMSVYVVQTDEFKFNIKVQPMETVN